jgi:SAM-dependent methyltransferase
VGRSLNEGLDQSVQQQMTGIEMLPTAKRVAKKMLRPGARVNLRRLYYYGHKFSCNLCGSSVRTLFDSGSDLPILRELGVIGGFKAQDSCPVCLMGARTRLVGRYLEHELLPQNSGLRRILHVAPERELIRIIQRQIANVEYIAADLHTEHYDGGVEVVRADITDLPWEADSFNLIICNHVLEHVPDDQKAMSELYRVTRPDGLAILQVPIGGKLARTIEEPPAQCPSERERRFGQSDHVRIYGSDYIDRLRTTGFRVEIFNPLTAWGPAVIELLRLDPDERIFVGRK